MANGYLKRLAQEQSPKVLFDIVCALDAKLHVAHFNNKALRNKLAEAEAELERRQAKIMTHKTKPSANYAGPAGTLICKLDQQLCRHVDCLDGRLRCGLL